MRGMSGMKIKKEAMGRLAWSKVPVTITLLASVCSMLAEQFTEHDTQAWRRTIGQWLDGMSYKDMMRSWRCSIQSKRCAGRQDWPSSRRRVWESTRGLIDVRNRWGSLARSSYLHYSTVHSTVTSIPVAGWAQINQNLVRSHKPSHKGAPNKPRNELVELRTSGFECLL